MAIFSRGPEAPAAVRAHVRGRALGSARAEDGTWLVGTRDTLTTVDGDDVRTLGWESVQRADWDGDTSTLRFEEVVDYGEPVRASAYVLPEPGSLLVLVRERVTASIVVQRKVPVVKKRGFTVIGRRPPAGGSTTWAFEFDAGIDPDDPEVRAAAEQALREVQESVGE